MYNYISILEKTNEQLSHWVSVSNWIIAVLGVFIALIAIFVGLALFKNSRDQKKQTEDFFDKLKARYEEEVKLTNKRHRESKDTFDKLIKEKEEEFKKVNEKQGEEIKKEINKLKTQQASIGVYAETPDLSSLYLSHSKSMFCIKCGKSFNFNDQNPLSLASNSIYLAGVSKVYCPHCGEANMSI